MLCVWLLGEYFTEGAETSGPAMKVWAPSMDLKRFFSIVKS